MGGRLSVQCVMYGDCLEPLSFNIIYLRLNINILEAVREMVNLYKEISITVLGNVRGSPSVRVVKC